MNEMSVSDISINATRLIKHLKQGGSTNLVYRSKVIGLVSPFVTKQKKIIGKSFISFLNKIKPDQIISNSARTSIYKHHLNKKYG